LDKAYLDVTTNQTGLPTVMLLARVIRQQIRNELNLTASAGVAPPKCETESISAPSSAYRRVRVGVSNFQDAQEKTSPPALFE
jgi:impB/mucB/samB family protein